MAVASVILSGDVRKFAQLLGRQHAVGNRDSQHRRMLLNVESILQAQRAKLVFSQFARQESSRLVPELGNPFAD